MKTSELKLRIVTEVESLVDVYFGEDTFVDRMANTTLKIIIEQNKNKFDEMFKIFEDENGEIDAKTIVSKYAEEISDEGLKFDVKKFVKNDMIKNILPDKFLLIKREDLMKIAKD